MESIIGARSIRLTETLRSTAPDASFPGQRTISGTRMPES